MKNLLLSLSFSVVCIQVYPQVAIPYNNDTLWVHPVDNSSGITWGAGGLDITDGNGAESDSNGYANTQAIVAEIDTGAAYLCDTLTAYGYNDWYLPAKVELDSLYQNRNAIGDFIADDYWSSTEDGSSTAWYQYFGNGNQNYANKNYFYRVRCVRRSQQFNNLTISLDTLIDITCDTCQNGEIHITAAGGIPPYTFSWSNGSTDSVLTTLDSAGRYMLTVTDYAFNTISDTFYIRHFDTIIDPRDDKVYKIVKIGDQWWMAQNLNATKYSDGTDIENVTGETAWSNLSGGDKAYCYYDNDSSSYAAKYGALYTWAAAMNGVGSDTANPSSVQGVCPNGWHLPSDNEWKQLERNLGMSKAEADGTSSRGTNQGSQLADSAYLWNNGALENDVVFGITGFTAIPSGKLWYTGLFDEVNLSGYFWTSSLDGNEYAWNRYIYYNESGINRSSTTKTMGYSVRCVKDIVIDEPLAIEFDTVIHVSCYGEQDGEIHLSAEGGTPPYSYIWGNKYPDTNSMTNQTGGRYWVTITDAVNDSIVTSYDINEHEAPEYDVTVTPVACHGDSTGSINLNLYFDPNIFIWSNGETTQNISGIPAGNYTVTVTDYSGCDVIIKKAVLEPSALIINSSVINIGCNGVEEGAIDLSIAGGTPSYTYFWNDSSTTRDRTALSAGNYSVTVTDSNNCTTFRSFTISTTESIVARAGEDKRVCPGRQVSLTASGGDSYAWNTGAETQTINVSPLITTHYIVEAEKNGCTDYDTVTVFTDSSYCFAIDVQTDNATCGQADGTATLDIQGGASPFDIQWSTGDTAMSLSTLQAGQYNVQVKDAHDNVTFKTFVINNTSAPSLSGSVTDVSCFNGSDGSINLTVTGGTAPYQYTWSTGAVTKDIQNMGAGYFEVEVEDQNGCLVFGEYLIDEPDPMITEIMTTKASCLADTGSIHVSVSGGASPYNYTWSNDSVGSTINSLGIGTYTVTIMDENNCKKTATTSISSTDGPVISIDSIVNATCNMDNGKVYTSVTGGSSPYEYSWNNGVTDPNLYYAGAGLYVLTVKDQNGCQGIASAQIDVEPVVPPQICIVTTDSITNHNIIAWAYDENPGVLAYTIYKEVRAGTFQAIGTISSTGDTEFEDSLSNPMIRSYKYKLSALDACGNESEQGVSHKTIHLSAGLGFQANSVNLMWDNYEGFYYDAYEVYRYSASLGWQLVEAIPGYPEDVFNSYTDVDVPEDILHYIISVDKGSICRVTGEKASGGPYSRSISNLEDNRLKEDNILEHHANPMSLTVSPNPSGGEINISYVLQKQGEVSIELLDVFGRKISDIMIQHYPAGKHTIEYTLPHPNMYFIKCTTNGLVSAQKVICQ